MNGASGPGALGGSDGLLSQPDADRLAGLLGGRGDGEELVVGQADALDVAAGVFDGGPSGSGHEPTLASTENSAKPLTDDDFGAYSKSCSAEGFGGQKGGQSWPPLSSPPATASSPCDSTEPSPAGLSSSSTSTARAQSTPLAAARPWSAGCSPASRRPRLLDLFGGERGAAEGYRRAGFDVVSVDNVPKVGPGPAVVADALDYLAGHWQEFDAAHASPPCHDHSSLAARSGKDGSGYLLHATLAALAALPLPYVVENVAGADMPTDLILCGTEFDLSVVTGDGVRRWLRRHRRFAASFPLVGAGGCRHKGKPVVGVYGTGGGGQMTRGYKADRREACEVMGMPWATRAGVSQAIPPVFTEHIGRQLLAHLTAAVAA